MIFTWEIRQYGDYRESYVGLQRTSLQHTDMENNWDIILSVSLHFANGGAIKVTQKAVQ
jgi:hypothetical protein